MKPALDPLILDLFAIGAIKIDTKPGGGWKLKRNERDPSLPLSPVYFNFRIPENGGVLTDDLVARMAELIWDHASLMQHKYIAGIPRAGTPFGGYISETYGIPSLALTKKTNSDGSRSISGLEIPTGCEMGGSVIPIDDLITEADTKLEAARVLTSAGYAVPAIGVFLDREQGGREMLQAHGIELTYVTTRTYVLDLLTDEGRITAEDRNSIDVFFSSF